MAPASLLDGLGDQPLLIVDSAPIIYTLEGHARLAARFAPVFEAADAGAARILISTVTLAEVLAGPLRSGNEALAARYLETLTRAWEVMPVDVGVAVEAARIRTSHRLRLPDAIQVATAIRAGATALVTHDGAFTAVRGLKVVGPE